MADRGFTVKDVLKEIGVELNIPPFIIRSKAITGYGSTGRKAHSFCKDPCRVCYWEDEVFFILKQTMPILLA